MKLFGQVIGRDKWLHFGAGGLLGMLGIVLMMFITLNGIALGFAGLILPTFVGLLKEYRDSVSREGQVEALDVAFTIFGGIFITIIALLFILL